jgi:hypothetical protein
MQNKKTTKIGPNKRVKLQKFTSMTNSIKTENSKFETYYYSNIIGEL